MWSLAVAGLLGLLILVSALAVVFLKNPVYSALAFLANLCLTAILYLAVLSAPFLAIVQVIVYMGAILVFILFVIMLVNLKKEDITERFFSPRLLFALVVVVVFLAQMLLVNVPESVQLANYVHAKDIAQIIFTKYALLFELVSVLIFAAAVGAVALAKKRM
ncbi:NADH-quinone oxidoreductase subunit J [Thermosulfidibacter takaii ABI70S6]|uniref:NADH-quinone oxidoreductase subunit J n=1 Tax=Thermosulfidibacter takaii (strain DSM 17441 / JCM 13301 / NBRC 103674 / ABI70S6) TaxID=1298851 RepID=A0A0S3QRS3_THET7|nr:NADH-quinone oxidoreductase subunit J [Thermosulfidibacter takaii]BAT71016.1 NADH-quinone oxidoreductase subunit J [Thermosulfidibacter takaii ABI70S6]